MDHRLLDAAAPTGPLALLDDPENEELRVVFFPDRVFHHRVVAVDRSDRYDVQVLAVRDTADICMVRARVALDDVVFTEVLRIEYGGRRLREAAAQRGRRLGDTVTALVRLVPPAASGRGPTDEVAVTLHRDGDGWAAELWSTLDPPAGHRHDLRVRHLMGRDGPVTHVPALGDLTAVERVELRFAEPSKRRPDGLVVPAAEVATDDNYVRSHEEPRVDRPSDPANTVADRRYALDFRRGFLVDSRHVAPVRYRNAMLGEGDPDRRDDNIVEMRWLFQQELGGTLVFFHEVTIPGGAIEGTHQHTGTEELYYVVEGSGYLYVADGDVAGTESFPLVDRPVLGVGPRSCREVPVQAGTVLFTKSGGVHGVRNPGTEPLRFVAFLYHTS
jgi:mannose-6-phosphate isomerase-like protein (cupin superfamily)